MKIAFIGYGNMANAFVSSILTYKNIVLSCDIHIFHNKNKDAYELDKCKFLQSGQDCEDNFVRLPRTKKAVIKGLKNMIVIDEGDVLLIYPKDQEQEIKSVRKDLNDDSVI